MIKRFGAVLVAAFMLIGCKNTILDPTTEATGKVVDHVSSLPLEGVTVTLWENDDVLLGGGREVARQQTDSEGRFAFKFEWKDSPYKIRVGKEGYTYHHLEYNERFNIPPVVMDYRILESLKKKQDFLFDMEPVGDLVLNLTDSDPQRGTNKITIKFEKVNKLYPVVGPQTYTKELEGYHVGAYAIANNQVRYTYTIEKDGTSQSTVDSILIKHRVPTVLDIVY